VNKTAGTSITATKLGLGIALAAVLATTIGIRAVGAAFLNTPVIETSGGEAFELAGLMPGDVREAAVVHIKAGGSVSYRIRVEWSGSADLARELNLTLVDTAGTVLYRGSLAEAHVGGQGWTSELDRRLADGQADAIVANAKLPLEASDKVQGAAVTAHIVLEVTESAG
jgi:hypothetical protein